MTALCPPSLRRLALGLGMLALASCSSLPESSASIARVKYYHLVADKPFVVNDQAIMAERAYHLHGAITKAETLSRSGNYYTVFWRARHEGKLKVVFEYRQAKAGLKPRVKEVLIEKPEGSGVAKFEVIGDEYAQDGRVTAWRVSIVDEGGQELDFESSYLWD